MKPNITEKMNKQGTSRRRTKSGIILFIKSNGKKDSSDYTLTVDKQVEKELILGRLKR